MNIIKQLKKTGQFVKDFENKEMNKGDLQGIFGDRLCPKKGGREGVEFGVSLKGYV